jgi:hypothetical protein
MSVAKVGHGMGELPVRGVTRLRVLNELPQQHRDYFCGEIRTMCSKFVASLGIPMPDRESETLELFSEIMAKLLGATSRRAQHGTRPPSLNSDDEKTESPLDDRDEDDEFPEAPDALPTNWVIDNADPKKDGRVAWLIEEIGGRRAMSHRLEDMRRRRWGRWQESGYREVQISALQLGTTADAADEGETLGRLADPSHSLQDEPEDPHHDRDRRRVWTGLLALAEAQFKTNDDVSVLLRLLAYDGEVQAAFGSEWPIRQIVHALNAAYPNPVWNDDRVDNAKKRLRNWIARIKRDQGLDATDLMALFARYARERENRAVASAATKIQSPINRPSKRR